jgi:hypothetical protein
LPFDRPLTPPAKGSNPTPLASTEDQRAMTIAMKAKIYNSTFSEFLTVILYFDVLIFPQGMLVILILTTR